LEDLIFYLTFKNEDCKNGVLGKELLSEKLVKYDFLETVLAYTLSKI